MKLVSDSLVKFGHSRKLANSITKLAFPGGKTLPRSTREAEGAAFAVAGTVIALSADPKGSNPPAAYSQAFEAFAAHEAKHHHKQFRPASGTRLSRRNGR